LTLSENMQGGLEELAHPDTLPDQLSEENREALASIMEASRSEGGGGPKGTGKVTVDLCNIIQEMYTEGTSVSDIIEHIPVESPNTVYYHLRGDCTHSKRAKISYSECGWMRVKANKGESSKTISEEYNVTQRNAAVHITGKCSHEDGVDPVEPETLRSNSHTGPSMTISVCPVCGDEFDHKEYRERTTCSSECNVVYASRQSAKQRVSDD
jgi:hypothetical protein